MTAPDPDSAYFLALFRWASEVETEWANRSGYDIFFPADLFGTMFFLAFAEWRGWEKGHVIEPVRGGFYISVGGR